MAGMLSMAYLLLSKNMMLLWIVKKASGESFIDDMMRKADEKEDTEER